MSRNTGTSTLELTDSQIRCRRRLGLRIGVGIFGAVIGAMCLGLLLFAWPSPMSLAQRAPADVLDHVAPLLLVPLAGLLFPTLLLFYLAGPADLIVNLAQRSYRLRRGFPLLASWKNGSVDDMAGLRVNTVRSKSSTSYELLLDWRNTEAAAWTLGDGEVSGRRPFQMAFARDAGQMREEAQRLSQRLGIPVQEATPLWQQKRSRAQTGLALACFVIFFALLGLPPLLVSRALQAQGQETSAVVTSLRHGKAYSVGYEYQVGGRAFDGRSSASWSTYSDLNIGSRIAVRYLPGYPHTSAMVGAQ